MKKTVDYILGIDEVGRGPVAGPVCVCAFKIEKNLYEKMLKENLLPDRDSKKLTDKKREEWFKKAKKWKEEEVSDYAISYVDARMIDRFGIVRAIKAALEKTILILGNKEDFEILLDGGLKAPERFKNQKTIIKGDEKEPVIALASICAKVSRDNLMIKMSKKFPNYGFEMHKGYGTKSHLEAIKKFGKTEIHRNSFLGKTS